MSELRWDEIDRRAVDTARVLAADAVEKVGNGHPGTAMSLAPAAYLLYQRVMDHDPADVHWAGRDRFILSAGPLVADAVRAAVSRRVRAGARRPEGAAHVGLADPRSPRVRPHRRRRDHHRPAGPGPRLFGRVRVRGPLRARAVRSGCRSRRVARSTTSSTSSRPTATCRRASPARRPRSPATRSSATSS